MTAPARIGKYEVTGELGKGAMGVVYSGVDPVIHRDVALKVLRKADLDPEDAPSLLERFKREAQAAGKLNHPNIVAIYEYGEDDEYAFIAMECVPGKSLREHLQGGYRPELRHFPDILVQILEGLEYSHSRGVVHRDIKPANILISEMGVAKISDFGIARLETSHLTMMGEVLGTPFYMPPEQFNGEAVDERSDIYSAGVIVFEVLTGRRPFEGTTAALVRKVLGEQAPKPSSLDPRLTPALDRVILQALAKKPVNRYSSARAFLHALQSAFDNRPIDALVPGGAGADRAVEDTLPQGSGTVVARLGALRKSLAQPGAGAGDGDAADASTPRPSAAKPVGPSRKPRLLFVDDEERVVNALRAIFRDAYDVETATSAEAALALIRERKFHVIVSDQRMPGMLGVDFLREAKAASPEAVRILLTGYSDLAAIVGSVNDGEVYRFVSKPWNQDDLQQTVGEAVTIAIALEASPPPRTAVQKKDDLVAIVLDDKAMARATREMAGDLCRVLPAATLEEALQLLADNEVAVLVADLESKRVDNTVLFKLLKQEHPETLVVVTTRASDSELIISLINEARIFRFINKPVNLTLLQNHLVAALERYISFKQSPELMATQRAKRTAADVRESTLGRSILDRLKGLGSRLTGALRGGD